MSPLLTDKIGATMQVLRDLRERFAEPIIFFSGGKDSMVLMHLALIVGYPPRCIAFTEPWLPRKWAFLRTVAAGWDLEVIEYDPIQAWAREEPNGQFIIGASYQTGGGNIALPWDVIEPSPDATTLEAPFRCGLQWMARRTGGIDWIWDLILIGHKNSDAWHVIGDVPLQTDSLPPPPDQPGQAATTAFPLRDWTDADIWEYTTAHRIPVDWRRYHRGPLDPIPVDRDTPENPDAMHACVACLRTRHQGAPVHCPATGQPTPCMADKVIWQPDLRRPYFQPPAA